MSALTIFVEVLEMFLQRDAFQSFLGAQNASFGHTCKLGDLNAELKGIGNLAKFFILTALILERFCLGGPQAKFLNKDIWRIIY